MRANCSDNYQIMADLKVTPDKYKSWVQQGRDNEEALRKLKKDHNKKASATQHPAADRECVICLERPADHIILDCMHMALCKGQCVHQYKCVC